MATRKKRAGKFIVVYRSLRPGPDFSWKQSKACPGFFPTLQAAVDAVETGGSTKKDYRIMDQTTRSWKYVLELKPNVLLTRFTTKTLDE